MRGALFIEKNQSSYFKLTARLLIVTTLLMNISTVPLVQAADVPADKWVTVPVKSDPMMQGLTIPANASTQGMWSGVKTWPLNGLHLAVLPDGRVLSYGSTLDGAGQNGRYFDLWDVSLGFGTGSHQTTYRAQQQDSFCSTATFLNNGSLMISGGNGGKTSTIFTPSTNTITTPTSNMALQRWYSTMINLPDGRPIMLGGMVPYTEGMVSNPDQAIASGQPSMTPEVYENGAWRSLLNAYSRDAFGPDNLRTSYPRAWVAPNGQVFGISADKMWYLDANASSGNGAITYVANFKQAYSTANPVNVGAVSTAVMFDKGKVLQLGGNGGFNGDGLPASNMATVVDINGATPTLTEQPRMANARRYPNAVVLASGQVVVTGGTKKGNDGGANTVLAAELWNPNTSTWTTGANAAILRVYHSQTALMPNGTVLSTGGGAPGPVTNVNAEIYYPPDLFKSVNGASQLATRPVIKAISGLTYSHNAALQLDMGNADSISKLVLIGLSNGTHSFNAGQRRIPLDFTQQSYRLSSTIPNANLTPPGYYQLVAIDANGVPSVATIIGIGQDVVAPTVPTSPYTPPDVSGTINASIINSGGSVNYTVTPTTGTTYSWNFGDGTADTPYSTNPATSHTYAQPGAYVVTLSAKDAAGVIARRTFMQAVATSKTAKSPNSSTAIALEARAASSARVWVVNPDNDSVSVIDTVTKGLVATINVGVSPRNVAVAADGRIWVTNKKSATISVVSPTTLAVVQTINLPRASQPHGLAFSPDGTSAFVVLEATGQLLKLNPTTGVQQGVVAVGSNARHVAISADATKVLVSRFITPPLPGESTATVNTSTAGAEVAVVNPDNMSVTKVVTLRHSDKTDTPIQGSGIPNYLAAAVISPDGTSAWVPSKQDNIKRGTLRSGLNLDFQNTVRAISSRIDMNTLVEDYAKRIDHDNASLGSAAVYHPSGVYLFVALETSRQVAVVDAIRGSELFKFDAGRAPQGLAISADGNTLYVQEFMDRSVSIVDLSPLTKQGLLGVPLSKVVFTVSQEKLPARVVLGKQLFYDAKDTRLARDSYMSCASCHNDGGHDGRVWDLTGMGEGLRNTIALKGRAALGHGDLHWSANFDELQDFEKQIRDLAGGLGLMTDAQYNTGTRNQALGDKKTGVSTNLDDLAAYVASLNTFDETPYRNADASLTASATAGKALFQSNNCASCHAGNAFTASVDENALKNIGTIKTTSGKRLNGALTGIDVPTLRDVWTTAPYLHDGSASTLAAAVQAHNNVTLNATDLANIVAYMQQIGSEEIVKTVLGTWKFNEGSGTSAADSVGNHPLALTNTAWVAGKLAQAGQFNGTSSVASTAARVVDTAQSFTVASWVKLDDLNGWRTMVNQDGENVSGFWLQYSQAIGNKFALTMHDVDSTTSTAYRAISATSPVTGQWYHVVGVRDKNAGTMKLYVNGQLEGTTAYTGGWAANGNLNVGRGKWGGPNDWVAGAIDEVSVFNYAASDSEVAQLYTSGSTPVNVPPVVAITVPATNISLVQGADVTITAAASDSDGTVARVEFYDGANLLNTLTTAPYAISGSTAGIPLGAHSITVKAYDDKGVVTTSSPVVITINAPSQNNQAPTAAITVPASNIGLVQGADVTITVVASDSDGTIARVEFYDGANLLNTLTTAPYAISGSTAGIPLGAHSITVKAYDDKGAVTTSSPVVITINAPSQNNQAPTAAITVPASNISLVQGADVTITAAASDSDGTVARVEFYDGANLLNTLTTAPYAISGSTAGIPLGAHSITVKAYDDKGAVTTSAPVVITINVAN